MFLRYCVMFHNHYTNCVIFGEMIKYLCNNTQFLHSWINCYPTWVIIYPSITHTYVDIVQRLCKYLPTLCTGKYLHNIYVFGNICPCSSVGGRNRFPMSIFCRKLCILKHLRCFVANLPLSRFTRFFV